MPAHTEPLEYRRVRSLLKRARGGDERAFTTLYDRYAGVVYRYLLRKSGHKETTEDVLIITFVNAWRALPRYEPREDTRFSTWLIAIAKNALIDEQRKIARNRTADIDLVMLAEVLPDDKPSPEAQAEKSLAADRVRSVVATLPEPQRTLIELRFFEGFNVTETAERLGKSEGAIRVMQHRTLTTLRSALSIR